MTAKRHRQDKQIRQRGVTVCYKLKFVKKPVRVCKKFLFFGCLWYNQTLKGRDRLSQKTVSNKRKYDSLLTTCEVKEGTITEKSPSLYAICLLTTLSIAII